MPSVTDLQTAIGCLSTVFPQYVAKELATLTDQIATAVQGFTDPLAAVADLHIDTLVEDVGLNAEGDIFGNLTAVAAGLGTQYVQREVTDFVSAMAEEVPSVTKRIQQIRNLSGQVATSVGLMMSLFPDMPYAAAQRMCAAIIELDDLKTKNLTCLRKHIVQLVNTILALAKNGATYKATTFATLAQAEGFLKSANTSLGKSQIIKNQLPAFDSKAFARAREALENASALLVPPKGANTILDLVDLLDFGTVPSGGINPIDEQLTMLSLVPLMTLIEQEANAIVGQVQVINFYVSQLGGLITSYRAAGGSLQVQQQRARAIAKIRKALEEIIERMDLAQARGSVRAAAGEMLFWSSRVKAILSTMESIKTMSLQEGSSESAAKAAQLATEYALLMQSLTGINNLVATTGIENPLTLRDQVLSLTKGARRLMKDIEDGRTDENHLATFHRLALVVATNQASRIEQSETVASLQTVACRRFAAIDLAIGSRYDQLLDSMRQLGLDRGVDMLNAGAISDFLNTDLQRLSYVGTAIECLRHGIEGTDDVQTRQQLGKMRDDLIAKRGNLELASADSADQGRTRFVTSTKNQVATVQKNAKTVEAIVSDLKQILSAAGGSLDESLEGLSQYNALLGNLDHLAVGAGGRLAGKLEEFSEHPNAGVVECDHP